MQQLIMLCLKVFSFVVHKIAEVSKSAILSIKCMLLNINLLFIELGLSSYITLTIMFWSEYQLDWYSFNEQYIKYEKGIIHLYVYT